MTRSVRGEKNRIPKKQALNDALFYGVDYKTLKTSAVNYSYPAECFKGTS